MDTFVLMTATLAKALTKEKLVDMLEKEVKAFKEAKYVGKSGEEEYNKLTRTAILVLVKSIDADPFELAKEIERNEGFRKLFIPNKS